MLHFLQPDDALGQQQRSGFPSFMQAPNKSQQSSGLAAGLSWAVLKTLSTKTNGNLCNFCF